MGAGSGSFVDMKLTYVWDRIHKNVYFKLQRDIQRFLGMYL